jgi:hypothetical protein
MDKLLGPISEICEELSDYEERWNVIAPCAQASGNNRRPGWLKLSQLKAIAWRNEGIQRLANYRSLKSPTDSSDEPRGETLAAADVASRRARTELARVHVLNHALAQRGHRLRTHGMISGGSSPYSQP